jgi:tRNA1(Val) A37 N6-methylase TrmN6
MNDQFFTPEALAISVVRAARNRKVRLVADFAAGHGDLLAAAINRWPSCKIVANDIDPSCTRKLRISDFVHAVSQCDFLDERSRKTSRTLSKLKSACDVVLLNPPFSGRGSTAFVSNSINGQIRCSRAFAFVLTAFDYLRVGGELVAILPQSCLTSEKDYACREFVQSVSCMTVIERFSKSTFYGCSASTVVVRFRKGDVKCSEIIADVELSKYKGFETFIVRLVRGCLPVHRALDGLAGTRFPFVHSTEIVGPEVTCFDRFVDVGSRCVSSPSVLITRVGSQKAAKCSVYLGKERIVLSDCVIALECDSVQSARKVSSRLVENWELVASHYEGTCAPYITMDALIRMLRRLGIKVVS